MKPRIDIRTVAGPVSLNHPEMGRTQDHQVIVAHATGVAAGADLATISIVIGGVEDTLKVLKAPSDATGNTKIIVYQFTACGLDAIRVTPASGLTLASVRWNSMEVKSPKPPAGLTSRQRRRWERSVAA